MHEFLLVRKNSFYFFIFREKNGGGVQGGHRPPLQKNKKCKKEVSVSNCNNKFHQQRFFF
jgi:hypothetical protein